MRSRLDLAWLLIVAGAAWAQFQPALPGYQFVFPRDHFNHPEYQTEWWYYTGNLKADDGRRFGYELTFFRQGVSRDSGNTSTWAVRDLYFAHLALSDLNGHEFYHTERHNRAGPGLAGASQEERRIWNGNWQAEWQGGRQVLQAIADNFSLQLELQSGKPPVIHGENGVSQKAAGAGHASHYISFTRLATRGSIELKGKVRRVDGTSWMDHEFFTDSMSGDEVGWDWLSLQLADDTEVMLYRLRHKDGSADPYSSGTLVDAGGRTTHLSRSEFRFERAGETWTSPRTGATYPVAWHVSIPSIGLEAGVRTEVKSQEMTGRTRNALNYWEGAISAAGRKGDAQIAGVGFLEMTGYDRALSLDGEGLR